MKLKIMDQQKYKKQLLILQTNQAEKTESRILKDSTKRVTDKLKTIDNKLHQDNKNKTKTNRNESQLKKKKYNKQKVPSKQDNIATHGTIMETTKKQSDTESEPQNNDIIQQNKLLSDTTNKVDSYNSKCPKGKK